MDYRSYSDYPPSFGILNDLSTDPVGQLCLLKLKVNRRVEGNEELGVYEYWGLSDDAFRVFYNHSVENVNEKINVKINYLARLDSDVSPNCLIPNQFGDYPPPDNGYFHVLSGQIIPNDIWCHCGELLSETHTAETCIYLHPELVPEGFCTYCRAQKGHSEDKCWRKHPELKPKCNRCRVDTHSTEMCWYLNTDKRTPAIKKVFDDYPNPTMGQLMDAYQGRPIRPGYQRGVATKVVEYVLGTTNNL